MMGMDEEENIQTIVFIQVLDVLEVPLKWTVIGKGKKLQPTKVIVSLQFSHFSFLIHCGSPKSQHP